MMKALGLVTLLVVVASASAGIDLFMTQQTAASNTYMVDTNRFNYNSFNFAMTGTDNPGSLSHGPWLNMPADFTGTFYVWAHFTDLPDSGNGQYVLYGCGLMGSQASGAVATQGVLYRQKKGTAYTRWDGTDPLTFPCGAAAVTATGVKAYPISDALTKDFNGDGTDYYSLLGCLTYTASGISQFLFGVANPIPFVAVRAFDVDGNTLNDWDTDGNRPYADAYYPGLTVNGQPYSGGASGSQPLLTISTIPEPASLALLGLAALLLRRR
jgi:hypothetical protein